MQTEYVNVGQKLVEELSATVEYFQRELVVPPDGSSVWRAKLTLCATSRLAK